MLLILKGLASDGIFAHHRCLPSFRQKALWRNRQRKPPQSPAAFSGVHPDPSRPPGFRACPPAARLPGNRTGKAPLLLRTTGDTEEASPAKAYAGSSRTEPTLRYFVDKYPLFLDSSSSLPSPVVTLSYVDPGHASIAGFKHHLQAYDALLRTLGDFHFLYISNTRAHFARATGCFSSLVQLPPQVDVSVEILRYFRLRQAWETEQYGTLDSDDIEWLQDATRRFRGGKYDAGYSAWASGRVGELELRKEFVQAQRQRTVEFRTYFTGDWRGCR
jgi:hypothetical protein